MTTDSLIDPDSAAKIGTVVAVATGEVYRRDWQRWAAAVGDHNPLWFDPDYARSTGTATSSVRLYFCSTQFSESRRSVTCDRTDRPVR